MKKFIFATLTTLAFTAFINVSAVFAANITSCGGWHESMFITWSDDSNADNATAYYKKSSETEYTTVDDELTRSDGNSGGRVDIVGLSAGTYDIKVTCGDGTEFVRTGISVDNYDRSGYAHFNYTGGVGAYNDDGTLKENAVVLYVTNENKNTITLGSYTGIGNILAHANKYSTPIDVRFIGTIDTKSWFYDGNNGITQENSANDGITVLNGLTSKTTTDPDIYLNMLDMESPTNVTIEGIGTDATIEKWGFTFKRCNYVEARNLHFSQYPEDGCSFIGDDYASHGRVWLHDCTFDVGYNDPDINTNLVDDHDKGDGDGASDFAKVSNVTIGYNKYNNCHKTSLNGNGDSVEQYNITWHHNYFNGCDSRMPLVREANVHIYNNYYTPSTKGTAISARAKAWVFSEANYYEQGKYRFETKSITSYLAPIIKSYNDYYNSASWTNGDTDGTGTIITTNDRDYKYSYSCNTDYEVGNGLSDYKYPNFDTDSSVFYYANGKTDVELLETAENAKTTCIAKSGVLKTSSVIEGDDGNPQEDNNELKTHTLTFNEFTAENILADKTEDIFTIKAQSDTDSSSNYTKHMTVANGSVSASESITGQEIKKILKSNGSGRKDYRSIYINVTKPSTITVQGKTASNNTERVLQLYDESFTAISGKALTSINSITTTSFFVPAGNYYLGSTNSGFNIYAIVVQEIEFAEGSASAHTPAIVGNGTDRYALVVLDSEDAQAAQSVTLQSVENDTASSNGVTIDGTTYFISDFADNGAVVLGYDITEAVASYTSAEAIQSAVGNATVNQ